jgi:alkylation response protein AidB-like acyl-CoA dehydrogenase
MQLPLSDEQVLLKESVERFLVEQYSFDVRKLRLKSGQAFERSVWQHFADAGWLGVIAPIDLGGIGGSMTEAAIVATGIGRGLVTEPFLGSAILATHALSGARSTAAAQRALASLIDGTCVGGLAYLDPQGPTTRPAQTTIRMVGANELIVSGCKTLVLAGAEAAFFIVSAQIEDLRTTALLLVDAGLPGVRVAEYRLHDGRAASDVSFEDVRLSSDLMLCRGDASEQCLSQALAHGTVGACAEAVGVTERAIDLTSDYLKVRHQFGVPLGSFQALQHKLADAVVDLEVSRAMLARVVRILTSENPTQWWPAVHAAKALIGDASKRVTAQCLQLHGGMGMTEEYPVGHYLKRAIVLDALFGNSRSHLQSYAKNLREQMRAQA